MEGFNLLLNLIKASNNFNKASNNLNPTRLFILRRKWYYGTFPAGYNVTLRPLVLLKDNYLGRFGSHSKNPRANHLAPENLNGHFIKGRTLNLGGRKDGRIDISIDVIHITNYIRIYCGLLRVNYRS